MTPASSTVPISLLMVASATSTTSCCRSRSARPVLTSSSPVMYALRTLSPDSDGARLYARWIETLWGELPLCRWLRGNIAVSTGGLPYACGAYVRNRELVAGAALLRDD